MAESKEPIQFEFEVQKYGKTSRLMLNIKLIRGPRGKKKLLGESFTRTVNQPLINFRVTNAKEVEGVHREFLKLLLHRGFLPLQSRTISGRVLGKWEVCVLEGPDADMVRTQERKTEG